MHHLYPVLKRKHTTSQPPCPKVPDAEGQAAARRKKVPKGEQEKKEKQLTVNIQPSMAHDLLDLPLCLHFVQHLARDGTVDLHPVDERRDGDEAVGLHVLCQAVAEGFVEDDGVVGLVLDCCFLKKY